MTFSFIPSSIPFPHVVRHRSQRTPRACTGRNESVAVQATTRWARTVVVGLGLCPFASSALTDGTRVRESQAVEEAGASAAVRAEIDALLRASARDLTTTLVVFPRFAADDFLRWHAFTRAVEREVECDDGICDRVMLACFHPEHTWAGLHGLDAVHFDRRAPYPTVNILRTEQVDRAVEQGLTQGILERNRETLQHIGYDGMLRLYKSLEE